MKKVLIGIHDKFCSMRAVEYLMKQCQAPKDVEVTLVNIFPKLPVEFWDDGHVLSPAEEAERQKVVGVWAGKQKDYIAPILDSAVYCLTQEGFPKEQIHTDFILGSADVADSLLDEARRLGCDTIVIGRCGLADGKHFVAGSKVSKLINGAGGLAVCIVQ